MLQYLKHIIISHKLLANFSTYTPTSANNNFARGSGETPKSDFYFPVTIFMPFAAFDQADGQQGHVLKASSFGHQFLMHQVNVLVLNASIIPMLTDPNYQSS